MTTLDPPREELDFLGCRARILLGASHPASLIEMLDVPPGHMPPLHVHHEQDEGFFVLEGQVTLFLPGRQIACSPGDFVLAPRGVPHCYRVGAAPARWLILSSPSGFERFVADVAALETADPAQLESVATAHGIELLGPPGTLP